MLEQEKRKRPTSLAEMAALMKEDTAFSKVPESTARYQPRNSDIIITPFGKCGTTWTQQIFHTLRTRGDMGFDDISRVVPWIETSFGLDIDINAEQKAEPRASRAI